MSADKPTTIFTSILNKFKCITQNDKHVSITLNIWNMSITFEHTKHGKYKITNNRKIDIYPTVN